LQQDKNKAKNKKKMIKQHQILKNDQNERK